MGDKAEAQTEARQRRKQSHTTRSERHTETHNCDPLQLVYTLECRVWTTDKSKPARSPAGRGGRGWWVTMKLTASWSVGDHSSQAPETTTTWMAHPGHNDRVSIDRNM